MRVTSTECVLCVSDCKRRTDRKANYGSGSKLADMSRSDRSHPTVTEIDLVQNGTYAELLPLQSTEYLEVANSS